MLETLEVVFAGCRPSATKLQIYAEAGGGVAASELTDVTAKMLAYEAFVAGQLECPERPARTVPDLYFEPK